MKLIRLKILDHHGFRGLPKYFEYCFRHPGLIDNKTLNFAPFVCAGPNGSGKSNLLEVLAAIFFHLDCKMSSYLPDLFVYDKDKVPNGYQQLNSIPNEFELEYLGTAFPSFQSTSEYDLPHIKIVKTKETVPLFYLLNADGYEPDVNLQNTEIEELQLLPDYIVAYSSGENEILSLPFFKRRFIQFDWYLDSVRKQIPNSDVINNRLVYLDQEFNQAILLCNYIFQTEEILKPFKEKIGLIDVKYFRIIIKDILYPSGKGISTDNTDQWPLLENIKSIQSKLAHCATAYFEDTDTDSHYYDFWLNKESKELFKLHFGSALDLFQAFQLLLTLNLYSVSNSQKVELYQSNSLYVNEIIPRLPSDQRVMRFKDVVLKKQGVKQETFYTKALSDGENQLLHTLGLCILYRSTAERTVSVLFLLDEPETHFNPQWRAEYISLLTDSLYDEETDTYGIDSHEMLITTHTPFLISDSEPNNVLVFSKNNGKINIKNPDYNTFGASISKINLETFQKKETIGSYAKDQALEKFKEEAKKPIINKEQLINQINNTLGDSIEKILLIKSILDKDEEIKG